MILSEEEISRLLNLPGNRMAAETLAAAYEVLRAENARLEAELKVSNECIGRYQELCLDLSSADAKDAARWKWVEQSFCAEPHFRFRDQTVFTCEVGPCADGVSLIEFVDNQLAKEAP